MLTLQVDKQAIPQKVFTHLADGELFKYGIDYFMKGRHCRTNGYFGINVRTGLIHEPTAFTLLCTPITGKLLTSE